MTSGSLTSVISWGSGTVKVLYDSTGNRTVGTTLSGSVTLSPYSVLVVQRA